MGSMCFEHHHNHHIPPRKLLSRRASLSPEAADYFSQSPRGEAAALMQKFLPCNNRQGRNDSDMSELSDNDSDDPYSSDVFRMYEFKIRKCTRSRSHDWTDCPFAHPGEKARRRDPRRFQYSGTVCPEYRRSGSCSRGDECEFAHGVFECWLHPGRYRTEACKDGKNCKRKVCFFAHSPRELRVLPPDEDGEERECKGERRSCLGGQQCCRYCCAHTLSPTSTLTMGLSNFSPPMSPSFSPPRSPMKAVGLSGFSPASRYSDRLSACGSSTGETLGPNNKGLSYEDMVIAELLGSFEGMSINNPAGHKMGGPNNKASGLWVDVGYDNSIADHNIDHQHQYSTPINYNLNANSNPSAHYYGNYVTDHDSKAVNDGGLSGPDLGWVNDLLM